MLALKNKKYSSFRSAEYAPEALIDLRDVVKIYQTEAGGFPALKGINLKIGEGEFVSVIGKSGSGKTTLINMLTGIDEPTSGEIHVAGVPIHTLSESEIARWRGVNMGVVFQFFQLLPTLTVLENVMLPMDFCNMYTRSERRDRAMHLLELVGIGEHAHKLPSKLSGGQQQRAAIARALANNPPIIATDEPTGNLDSRTAEAIFELFQGLVQQGTTILMVTHDDDLAQRATRTVIIADGEIVNEYVAKAMPTLTHEQMLKVSHQLEPRTYAPGEPIIYQGEEADKFYIITEGEVHVYLTQPSGHEIFVDTLGPGQYFGEMALCRGGRRTAMVRASRETPVEVLMLDRGAFCELLTESEETRAEIERVVQQRSETQAVAIENGGR